MSGDPHTVLFELCYKRVRISSVLRKPYKTLGTGLIIHIKIRDIHCDAVDVLLHDSEHPA